MGSRCLYLRNSNQVCLPDCANSQGGTLGAPDAPFTPYNLRVNQLKGTQPMPTTKVYAVIGGADYEGQDFNTLRLFDCFSTANDYAVDLDNQLGVDYVLIQTREVCQESALCAA